MPDKIARTPHPFNTCTSPLNIKGPVGNNLPRTFILFQSDLCGA
jgi:hypothetical protein